MRKEAPAQENRIRQEVILDASSLMRKLRLQAYILGEYPRKRRAGARTSFGIERAIQDYIERKNGHSRMAMIAGMVAIREKRISTIPPKEFSEKEPLDEGIELK